jgi:P27 family predicted phage terminase small subunit
MAKGRKANPAQSNVLAGNFRPDRHGHGPKVDLSLPPCPSWLPKNAKKHWAEIGELLQANGLISVVDSDVFALHCDSVAKYQDVTKRLLTLSKCIDSTPQGYQVQSVLFTIRNKLHEQITKTAREFGLTPSARASLKVSTPQGSLFDDEGGWGSV